MTGYGYNSRVKYPGECIGCVSLVRMDWRKASNVDTVAAKLHEVCMDVYGMVHYLPLRMDTSGILLTIMIKKQTTKLVKATTRDQNTNFHT